MNCTIQLFNWKLTKCLLSVHFIRRTNRQLSLLITQVSHDVCRETFLLQECITRAWPLWWTGSTYSLCTFPAGGAPMKDLRGSNELEVVRLVCCLFGFVAVCSSKYMHSRTIPTRSSTARCKDIALTRSLSLLPRRVFGLDTHAHALGRFQPTWHITLRAQPSARIDNVAADSASLLPTATTKHLTL